MTMTVSAMEAEAAARNSPVWTREAVAELFAAPFADLLHRAHETHRRYFDPNSLQLSTLLNIKTGGCPEDCKYCAQSIHYETGLAAGKLMAAERGRRRRRAGQGGGRDALLHGCRLARAQRPASRRHRRDRRRRPRARARDLHDLGHADLGRKPSA